MHLAINFSPAAASLAQSGSIDFDLFKTPDWEWMIEEARLIRPAAVHFTLEAGNNGLRQVSWDKVAQLAEATHTPYINLHLDAKMDYYPGVSVESSHPADVRAVYRTALADVRLAVDHFGADRVILENSPYRGTPGGTLRMCTQPEFISHLIEETGCGLLLDIAHACLAAHYMGMDAHDYFELLPVTQIKEMHFAGIQLVAGQLVDHLAITEADWQVLDFVITHIQHGEWSQPWMMAYEYGGTGEPFEWRTDPEVIRSQVPILRQKVNHLNTMIIKR